MNRVVLVMVGLLGLLALARPAQAGDIEIENPERAPFIPRRLSIWAGYYFGIYAGGALGRSNHDFPPATGNFTISGPLIGGTIGLNFQAGRGVAGIEFDAGWANIKGSTINNCPGLSCETNSSGLLTLRGRLGYAFERFLPFITAGVAPRRN